MARGIEACIVEHTVLNSYGMVRFDKNYYSIPDTAKLEQLWVKTFWNRIDITDGSKILVAPTLLSRILEERPGAVPYAKPIIAQPWPDVLSKIGKYN